MPYDFASQPPTPRYDFTLQKIKGKRNWRVKTDMGGGELSNRPCCTSRKLQMKAKVQGQMSEWKAGMRASVCLYVCMYVCLSVCLFIRSDRSRPFLNRFQKFLFCVKAMTNADVVVIVMCGADTHPGLGGMLFVGTLLVALEKE